MILVISSSYDRTCDYIIEKYENFNFFRFNIDDFSNYSINVSARGFEIESKTQKINSENCISIYYRKPSPENLSGIFDKKYHHFSYGEVLSVIDGLVEYFPGRCLSKPSVIRKAGNKTFQALTAEKVGFEIPRAFISNSIKHIDLEESKDIIVKPISSGQICADGEKEFVQTNMFKKSLNSSLIRYTPVYFQKYIKKDFEVRVTVVNKSFFPVRIDSIDPVDWRRPGNKVSYSTCTIPLQIKNSCIKFMNIVGIEFGCFDFIIKDEIWYFLEMNSNGQWAWLEIELGINISENIVSYLNDH